MMEFPAKRHVTERNILIVVFTLIIAVRIIHFYSSMNDSYVNFRVSDELAYHKWALNIASGHLLRDKPFFTTPLYAYFLGMIYYLGGKSVILIRLVNHVLGVGTAYLIYRTARTMLGAPAAILSALLSGLCISPVFYETFAEKTALVYFMVALALFLIVLSSKRSDILLWFLAGVSAGTATLGHAVLLVFVPVVFIHVAFNYRNKWKLTLKILLIFYLGYFGAILPATLHNYMAGKDFVLISYNGGQVFYAGNNAGNISGRYSCASFSTSNLKSEESDYNAEAERRTHRAMKPSEISGFWFQQGWNDIKDNPGLAAERYLRKLRWALGSEEVNDSRSFEFYKLRLPVLRLPLWNFGFVSFLGLLGLLLTIRDSRFIFLNIFTIGFGLAISCFFIYGRYRLPLLAPLSILASTAVIRIYDEIKARRILNLAAYLFALFFIGWFVLARVQPGVKDSFFTDYFNHGNGYLAENRKDLALAEYEKSLEIEPDNQWLLNDMAGLYLSIGNTGRAETLLERSLRIDPNSDNLWINMCALRTLKIMGNDIPAKETEASVEVCKHALELKPDSLPAMIGLAAIYDRAGNLKEAEKTYAAALDRFRNNPQLWMRMSEFHYRQMREINQAVLEAEKAVSLSGDAQFREWLDYLKDLKNNSKRK